jgi:hypothetical protein
MVEAQDAYMGHVFRIPPTISGILFKRAWDFPTVSEVLSKRTAGYCKRVSYLLKSNPFPTI